MSMPASLFHNASSAMCVPERSPRETKGACFSLIVFSAAATSPPLMPAGSFFGRFGMDKNHISVAASARVERLSCALRDDFDCDPVFLLKDREQILKQAAVLSRRCRGNDNGFFLRDRLCRQKGGPDRRDAGQYRFSS